MGQNLMRAENYLSLVGLVVLILGGIGVSSVTRVFVQQKVRSIAILKCVGSTTSRILAIYMTQVVVLGVAGSVLGVALAAGVIAALPHIVGDVSALLQADYGLTPAAVLQGLAIGLLVSVLFSLVPLLEIRHVKPGLLLRQDAPATWRFDWLKWIVTAAVAAALVGVAAWQAGSLTVGLVLSAGFVAVAVVLHVAGIILVRAVQPLRHARSFALRHAVLHVGRRGNQTRVILLAVGLGAFFILGVRTLQANLLRDFSVQVGDDAPDMFLIDVQPAQRDGVAALLDEQNGPAPAPRLIPVLRARVIGVEGKELNLETFEQVRGRGGLAREFTVTYRSNLEANEEIIAGKWWDSGRGRGARSLDRRRLSRAAANSGRRSHALRRAGAHHHGTRREHPPRAVGRFPRRRVHVRLPPGCVRGHSAHVHFDCSRSTERRRACPDAGGCRRQVSERVDHRPAGDPRHHSKRGGQSDAGRHGGRGAGALQRDADSDRRRVDDQVPACL
jgi:putative ABC transport system permease protein